MITIGVADRNKTYCQGLKTMLEQVEGFKVVLVPSALLRPEDPLTLPIDVLLVDEDLYEDCRPLTEKRKTGRQAVKTLVLTMDCNARSLQPGAPEAICKGAGKGEFIERIMRCSGENDCLTIG